MTTAQHPSTRHNLTENPEFQEALDRFRRVYTRYRKEVNDAFDDAPPTNHFLPDLVSISARYEPQIREIVEEIYAAGARMNGE